MKVGKRFLTLVFLFLLVSLHINTQVFAQGCEQIARAPNLYQVDRASTKATLYFTPVNTNSNGKYIIGYGTNQEVEQNSVTFSPGRSTGAIAYTINDLLPGSKYYFRVRAGNDCSTGPWSSWLGDNLTPTPTKSLTMPPTGSNTGALLAIIFLGIIMLGSTLFIVSSKKNA